MSKKRKTLQQRAEAWIRTMIPTRVGKFPDFHWFRWAWLAGYRAGKRDAKKGRK